MFAADWLLDAAITVIERTHRVENLATDELAAMLAGAEAFFSKPVSIEELWTEMNYLLEKKK